MNFCYVDMALCDQIFQIDQIKQWLFEAQKYLQDMIKVLNLDDEAISAFSVVTLKHLITWQLLL